MIQVIRQPVKPVKINNMTDTLNLETTNPTLYNIWKTKYKTLTCQQINKMFLEKEKKWDTSCVSCFETKDDTVEIEGEHERKNYADFWAFFEGITLQQDERVVDKAKQVVTERPDIFDEYINIYWNNNMRNYNMKPCKTFHMWLLDSTYSQTYQYMLEHNVTFKNARKQFRTIYTNNDNVNKLRQQYLDMMDKEEKSCVARVNASSKLLYMTSTKL
jgi:hypothetical protein